MFPEVIKEVNSLIVMILVPLSGIIMSFLAVRRGKKNKEQGGKTVPEQIKYQLNNGRVRKIEVKVNELSNDVKHVKNDVNIIKKTLMKK